MVVLTRSQDSGLKGSVSDAAHSLHIRKVN